MNELVIFAGIVAVFTVIAAVLWIVATIVERERRRTEPFQRLH